jgi:hypothetical protein
MDNRRRSQGSRNAGVFKEISDSFFFAPMLTKTARHDVSTDARQRNDEWREIAC